MYREITRNIEVEALPEFLPEPSSAEKNYYVFAYRIKITNRGDVAAQLLSRHWIITDGNGQVHEVKGDGVIGVQPRIAPGETYEYSSFCPLPTAVGNMRGHYQMVDARGDRFDIRVPLFFLRDLRNFH